MATPVVSPGPGSAVPCCLDTRKSAPITAFAATAPSSTTTRGESASSSAQNHGMQAVTCRPAGVLWIRRLPRCSKRKCLTAFVR